MVNSLSTILQGSDQVKNEQADQGNTKTRIGGLFAALARAGIYPYDPDSNYLAGQWCIFEGVLTEVVEDADAQQTPITHPQLYSRKIVIDPTQATEENDLPVAASVVVKLIDAALSSGGNGGAPVATTERKGIVRQSLPSEYALGTSNDTYVTPKQVKTDIANLLQILSQLSLLKLITAAPGADLAAIVIKLFTAAAGDANAKKVICDFVATCDLVVTPADPEYSFTGGVHFEASVASSQLNPTLNVPTDDWLIKNTGVHTKTLDANEFTYNAAVTKRMRANKYNGSLNLLSPLPDWITFDEVTRTLTATITNAQTGEQFPISIQLYDPVTGSSASDEFLFTVELTASTAQITRVGYSFQKNNPSAGQASTLDIYASSNVALEVAFSYTSPSGNGAKSGYSNLNAGTFQTDYNRYTSIYGVYTTQTATIYLREKGTTSDLYSFTLPVFPNANVPLTVIKSS